MDHNIFSLYFSFREKFSWQFHSSFLMYLIKPWNHYDIFTKQTKICIHSLGFTASISYSSLRGNLLVELRRHFFPILNINSQWWEMIVVAPFVEKKSTEIPKDTGKDILWIDSYVLWHIFQNIFIRFSTNFNISKDQQKQRFTKRHRIQFEPSFFCIYRVRKRNFLLQKGATATLLHPVFSKVEKI